MPHNNNIPGWFTAGDIRALEHLCSKLPLNGKIVEIGSLYGRSAVAWAMSTPPNTEIICIDRFPESKYEEHKYPEEISIRNGFPVSGKTYNCLEEFTKNTSPYPNITMIRGDSPEIAKPHDIQDIDILFLDAEHRNPSDWENLCYFAPRVKVGGYICGHDYNKEQFPDIVENVAKLESVLDTKAQIPEVLHGAVWWIKVTKKILPEDMIL